MAIKSIPLRKLGKNGPMLPAIGFGAMVMSGAYGKFPGDEERFKLLDHAYELGETFWDSADIYGDSEVLIGNWFKRTGKRSEIFVTSKFGFLMEGVHLKGFDTSAEYCKQACAKSIERLGVDYIDLYYAHRLKPSTPVEETMKALVELKAEGKIKYIGLSEVSSDSLRRACKITHVDAVQVEYSPFVLDIERESGTNILKTCRELGVAVVCSSPLGRGLITGTFTSPESATGEGDFRGAMLPRFSKDNIAANIKLVDQFQVLADKKGCTLAQLSLAWLLKQGDDIFPIPGTKQIKYLEQNWEALEIQLSDEEETEIRKFVEDVEPRVAGDKTFAKAKVLDFSVTKQPQS